MTHFIFYSLSDSWCWLSTKPRTEKSPRWTGFSLPSTLVLRVLVERRPKFRQGCLQSYSETESVVKYSRSVSSFFPVNMGVRHGCVLAPLFFNTCMDWILGKVVNQSHCGASVGKIKITELLETRVMALKEAKLKDFR